MDYSVKLENKIEDFIEELFNKAYEKCYDLNCTAYISKEPLSFENRLAGKKTVLCVNDKWAEDVFDCAWFHITGDLPPDIAEDKIVFLINCGGEGLICDRDGIEKQCITCFASDFDYTLGMPVKKVVINRGLTANGKVDFWIDCAANDLFGKMKDDSRMSELSLAIINPEIRALAYDLQVLMSVFESCKRDDFEKHIWDVVNETIVDMDTLTEEKASGLRALLLPLLQTQNDGDVFTYSAVGHAHLDLAWLWPLRESIRKGARTFSTQIMNIERYPDYVFGASQAQLYDWMLTHYPRIYRQVQALAKTPNWEVQGATWVEMDSNLIGGESLIRQFFYGKQFFQKEFGQEMNIFWVPDSFGYSACIPQVMKLANVPYFLTQKMSWNTVNKFPYHSFYWQGLDGSTVLAHMLPENTYNGPVRADFMKNGEKNYQEREISDKSMMLFGIGDGGAGPGFEHLERLNRFRDLKDMPKVKPEKAKDFFKRFDDGVTPYPTHKGELYLERHQGTYTTQSKNKRFNRKCEYALRNYEMLAVLSESAGITAPVGKEKLDTLWKEVLLYQFHDILPGSSINRVYEESVARYEIIYTELQNAIGLILSSLIRSKSIVNLNSFAYNKKVKLGEDWYALQVPALGYAAAGKEQAVTEFFAESGGNFIENDKIRIEFKDGCVSSFFDKSLNKEMVMKNEIMGVISQYTDEGDCWDIGTPDYAKTKKDAACISFRTGTDGAKAFAVCEFSIGDSTAKEEFFIIDNSTLLCCDLTIDCHQESAMLRIAFPTAVETDVCNFNIQFGHLARSTTENDSVEKAQYEVSAQKFVDMSEESFGLSFINDCKYGYRCKGGVIDLDLIRSPKNGPGTNVDQGEQTIHYALLPHSGKLGIETYREAYLLNNPFIEVGDAFGTGGSAGFFSTTDENIVLESIKMPEDGNGILARFYNCSQNPVTATVNIDGYSITQSVDIMEKVIKEKSTNELVLNGFELIILRFERK